MGLSTLLKQNTENGGADLYLDTLQTLFGTLRRNVPEELGERRSKGENQIR